MSSQVIDGWKPIRGVPGKTIVWQNIDGSYTVTIDPLAIGDGSGDMLKSVYDADGDNIVDLAESVPWSGVADRPTEFNPSAHTHDGDDITSQVGSAAIADSVPWSGVTDKPTAFPPSSHDHDDRYYTESETDSLLAGYVLKSIFDANTILIANSDDTPMALSVPASTLVGRAASGGIAALSAADARTVLELGTMALEVESNYAKLAGRSGGQTIVGGTNSTDDLVLTSKRRVVVIPDTAGEVFGVFSNVDSSGDRYFYVDTANFRIGSFFVNNGLTTAIRIRNNSVGNSAVTAISLINQPGHSVDIGLVGSATTMYPTYGNVSDGFIRTSASGGGFNFMLMNSTKRIKFFAAKSANQTPSFQIQFGDQIGISVDDPTISDGVGLDIGGKILRLRISKTPESASASGNVGEICWDSSYLYICTASNTWRRVAHSSW